jgi:prolipoprotein diacylglyceryl transferase
MSPILWNVDREIASIGPLVLRWYSLLFALGFITGYFILAKIFQKEGKRQELLDSLLVYAVLGTVIGARLGHCLFYEPAEYLRDPIRILKIWEGGLASHGGFTGVIIALILFCRKYRDIGFYWLADRTAIPAMLAAGFIRIGNLFNSEIIGKPAGPDLPWAFIFEKIDHITRHPTQIYEAIGYMCVSALLYLIYRLADRKPLEGRLLGVALVASYTFRFFIENFKEVQVNFEETMTFNMGQLLSVPFVLAGIVFVMGWHRKIPWLCYGFSPESGLRPTSMQVSSTATGTATVVSPRSRKGQLRKKKRKIKS